MGTVRRPVRHHALPVVYDGHIPNRAVLLAIRGLLACDVGPRGGAIPWRTQPDRHHHACAAHHGEGQASADNPLAQDQRLHILTPYLWHVDSRPGRPNPCSNRPDLSRRRLFHPQMARGRRPAAVACSKGPFRARDRPRSRHPRVVITFAAGHNCQYYGIWVPFLQWQTGRCCGGSRMGLAGRSGRGWLVSEVMQ